MSIFKILVIFSRREIEVLSENYFLLFWPIYLPIKRYLIAKLDKTSFKAVFASYDVPCP